MTTTHNSKTKPITLAPEYVTKGQYQALQANRATINQLERECAKWPARMLYGVALSWITGFLCGLALWYWS